MFISQRTQVANISEALTDLLTCNCILFRNQKFCISLTDGLLCKTVHATLLLQGLGRLIATCHIMPELHPEGYALVVCTVSMQLERRNFYNSRVPRLSHDEISHGLCHQTTITAFSFQRNMRNKTYIEERWFQ